MDAADLLLDPWRSGIDRRAMAEVLLLGGFGGALSFWVVALRLAYPAESLAHGLLPGLVLAALTGIPLLVGAGAGVALAALLVALAGRDDRIGPESATAVVITGAFGLGSLLALSPDAPARLEELLFGDPLGVTGGDLAAAAALAAFGGLALAAMHRPLVAAAFDSGGPGAPGLSADRMRLLLLLLLAFALSVAVQGLGSLLVLALLVGPAVAVGGRTRSPAIAMAAGSAVAAGAGVAGMYGSHHLDLAAGASVALALCGAAAAGTVLRRVRRGGPRARVVRAAAP